MLIESDPSEAEEDTLRTLFDNYSQPVDTINSQAFRVQLFTTKLYREAQEAVRTAEEIFDQSVYVDYEVPYFKVRVGSFADRDAAEDYQQRAKAAGYRNAWVVMVNVSIREATPLYDNLGEFPVPEVPLEADSVAIENDEY